MSCLGRDRIRGTSRRLGRGPGHGVTHRLDRGLEVPIPDVSLGGHVCSVSITWTFQHPVYVTVLTQLGI